MNRSAKIASVSLLAASLAAGCGAPVPKLVTVVPGTLTSAQSVSVKLTDFAISPPVINIRPGLAKFVAVNVGQAMHNFSVKVTDGSDRVGGTPNLTPGKSGTVTLRFGKGNYVGYCSEPGHESLGMSVAIVVR